MADPGLTGNCLYIAPSAFIYSSCRLYSPRCVSLLSRQDGKTSEKAASDLKSLEDQFRVGLDRPRYTAGLDWGSTDIWRLNQREKASLDLLYEVLRVTQLQWTGLDRGSNKRGQAA